ncbi:MAG TPA: SLC13 family permease [Chloroflexi bacterium]|nr:SLC13 family permease [Chloroflexota bacterium]
MWYALAILTAAIILFITEWLRVDVVAIGVVVALMLTGLLSASEALSGFSNSAVLTIAALFVVGGAVLNTGLAGLIGRRILAIAGTSEVRLTVVIMLAVALLSGFMSDTGTVAVLLPAIISLAKSAKVSPSKLLIPLAFGSLLGGAMTLIGTPPNIIVSDLLREEGLRPFAFFDYTPIGVLLLTAGVVFMVFVGRKLLPDNKPKQDLQRVETPDELMDIYRLPESLFRLRVRRGSELVGQTVAASRLGQNFGMSILEILRPAEPRPVVKVGRQQLVLQSRTLESIQPTADTVFGLDDILLVQGDGNDAAHAAARWNLGVQPSGGNDKPILNTEEAGLAEILLPPRSSLLGKTVVETRFGSTYHLTVLGINRPGADEKLGLKDTTLEFGDTLLVQGPWKNILGLRKRRRDFVVMGQPETMLGAPARNKAPIALLILLGMLAIMVTNILPVVTASMLAALAVILTGCLSMDDAYEAVNWKSIVLIAGMLPMAIALEKVGLVNLAAEGLTNSVGSFGPLVVLAGLFILTSLFTQVLSNTATTVLVAPIALATAQQLGVQPYAFMMAVAIAASMAFASPVASPVNTLVMGAGNYRFSDYIKAGAPMMLIMLIVTALAVPLLWPF